MRGTDRCALFCPTPIAFIQLDWVLPTDEVLADLALREAQRGNARMRFDRDSAKFNRIVIAY